MPMPITLEFFFSRTSSASHKMLDGMSWTRKKTRRTADPERKQFKLQGSRGGFTIPYLVKSVIARYG